MKKSVLFISLAIILLTSYNLKAQTKDMYNILEGKLGATEQKQVETAKEDIGDGDRMVSAADGEYQKYAKFFNSNKKSKKKKGEKKTVGAKKKLITAANNFQGGYETLFNLYKTELEKYSIDIPSDKQTIEDLVKDAEKNFKTGTDKLSKVKKYQEKDLKTKVKYQSLKGEVEKGAEKQKEAVERLVDALIIAEGQEDKKQMAVNRDNDAWSDAQRLNTIAAYQNYISNFPTGNYVAQAKAKISILEAEAKRIATQNNKKVDFYLQFAASPTPLSPSQMSSKLKKVDPYCTYSTMTDIVSEESHKYKYMFGPFADYESARKYERNLNKKEKVVFIVGYKEDKRLTIEEATEGINLSDTPSKKPIR